MERMVVRPSENKGGTAYLTPFANKSFAEGICFLNIPLQTHHREAIKLGGAK